MASGPLEPAYDEVYLEYFLLPWEDKKKCKYKYKK